MNEFHISAERKFEDAFFEKPKAEESAEDAPARLIRNHAAYQQSLLDDFCEDEDGSVIDPMALGIDEFRTFCFRQWLCGDDESKALAWEDAVAESRYLLSQTAFVKESEVVGAARETLREANAALSRVYARAFVREEQEFKH